MIHQSIAVFIGTAVSTRLRQPHKRTWSDLTALESPEGTGRQPEPAFFCGHGNTTQEKLTKKKLVASGEMNFQGDSKA
jgi:hypothetical protein